MSGHPDLVQEVESSTRYPAHIALVNEPCKRPEMLELPRWSGYLQSSVEENVALPCFAATKELLPIMLPSAWRPPQWQCTYQLRNVILHHYHVIAKLWQGNPSRSSMVFLAILTMCAGWASLGWILDATPALRHCVRSQHTWAKNTARHCGPVALRKHFQSDTTTKKHFAHLFTLWASFFLGKRWTLPCDFKFLQVQFEILRLRNDTQRSRHHTLTCCLKLWQSKHVKLPFFTR